MKVQVEKEHYDFSNYCDIQRWNSYYYQIVETLKCSGNNILIIGGGDNLVGNILKLLGKNVTTFDFDKNLNPDIVGSVTEIDKILTKKYDVILCCQVLEHIPFEDTIRKISQCFKEKFILSLPNCNLWIKFNLKLPKIKEINYKKPIYKFWKNKWDINIQGNGEHYWEIDAKGYQRKKIKNILSKYLFIENIYIPAGNTYHFFYIMKQK